MPLRMVAILTLTFGQTMAAALAADAPTDAVVTEADGKEVKVTGLKFGPGTRRLSWLADPAGTTDDTRSGPLALEVREPHSTTFKQGIVTLVPLASVESIQYDTDKKRARISIKTLNTPLAATLEYTDLNNLAFSAIAGGKQTIFRGGPKKGSVKAFAFAGATPLPSRKRVGVWQVQIDQKAAMNPTLKVGELKFLYRFPGGKEVLSDFATTHKHETLRFDGALKSYTTLAVDPSARVIVAEVASGDKERIVVIPPTMEKDGKTATLVGLVGEVEAGWKLFPLHTIKSLKRPHKD